MKGSQEEQISETCQTCTSSDVCPICLEAISDTDNVLCMPICMHRVHTKCELKAAQYDSRCPICRTKDPELTTRQDDDVEIYTNLEQLVHEHERSMRQYNQKRCRVIRQNSKLYSLREQLKRERRLMVESDKRLDQTWLRIQRDIWKNNTDLVGLKKERRVHQNRANYLYKKLEAKLEETVGPRPGGMIFNVDIEAVD